MHRFFAATGRFAVRFRWAIVWAWIAAPVLAGLFLRVQRRFLVGFVGVVHFRDRPLRGAGFFATGSCLRALGAFPAGRPCFSAIHFSQVGEPDPPAIASGV